MSAWAVLNDQTQLTPAPNPWLKSMFWQDTRARGLESPLQGLAKNVQREKGNPTSGEHPENEEA
jgi:hypothetical protein